MKINSGNALLLVLIAVALFAALTTAMVGYNKRGKGLDVEKARIEAAELLNYAHLVENTVNRLMTVKNCKDTEISFNHDMDGDGVYVDSDDINDNALAPTSLHCHVFHPNGGNLMHVKYADQKYAFNNSGTGEEYFNFWPVTIQNVGNDNRNSLVMLAKGVDDNLCAVLNKEMDIDQTAGDVPDDPFGSVESATIYNTFNGDYHDDSLASSPNAIGDEDSGILKGKPAGCTCDTAAYSGSVCSKNIFYYTVLVR